MIADLTRSCEANDSFFYGATRSTHGISIDYVNTSLEEARNAITQVTIELQEYTHRWKQIDKMFDLFRTKVL